MGEPMVGWIIQAVRRGRLTTRFPRAAPTEEELPPTARLPVLTPLPSEASRLREARCPTEAIEGTMIDDGRCLRCARCLPPGAPAQGPWDGPEPRPPRGPGSAGSGNGPGPDSVWAAPFARSLHVFPIDVGSCQACNLEVLALANPYYDASRLGIFFTPTPRHADLLLVMGVPTAAMEEPFRRTLEAMPTPKAIVAVGACAVSGGLFRHLPGRWAVESAPVPVIYVPGCPPAPVQILAALRRAVGTPRAEGERR
jgi:formate hydrogenlyase subunit 7